MSISPTHVLVCGVTLLGSPPFQGGVMKYSGGLLNPSKHKHSQKKCVFEPTTPYFAVLGVNRGSKISAADFHFKVYYHKRANPQIAKSWRTIRHRNSTLDTRPKSCFNIPSPNTDPFRINQGVNPVSDCSNPRVRTYLKDRCTYIHLSLTYYYYCRCCVRCM